MSHARAFLAMLAAAACTQASAQCPDNRVDNPSFEEIDPANSSLPRGWGLFNTARLRTSSDGILPFFARTGDNSIEFPSGTDFSGVTTDVLNPQTHEFNNPLYEWQGGDVTVSGWYLIPASDPLVGAASGIKLEFRRENLSIFTSFEVLNISGDTNGEWVEFSFTVTDEDLLPFEMFPPFPVKVTVLPLRFGSAASTGTIFWDDICLVQQADEPCLADTNNDGMVTPGDFGAWVAAFNASAPECDQNGDGMCTAADFGAWVANYNAGCP